MGVVVLVGIGVKEGGGIREFVGFVVGTGDGVIVGSRVFVGDISAPVRFCWATAFTSAIGSDSSELEIG